MIVLDVEQIADGLVMVEVDETRSKVTRCLWTAGRLRKRATCVRCMSPMAIGERAYRPTRDTDYRMRRMCERCADRP